MLYQGKATDALAFRPSCDFCEEPAAVDGKTVRGPWANMCYRHHGQYGVGLGIGKGQVLLCNDSHDNKLIEQYKLEEK